jgi:CBS domain-containing membrane protein
MERDINIDLDVDEVGSARSPEKAARLAVVGARGYTRDGSAPTITRDCKTYEELEAEASRLKEEIDAATARSREHFDMQAEEKAADRKRDKSMDEELGRAGKPHIDTDLKVADVMTRKVRTVGHNDKLSLAAELMKLGRHRHVVVLDDDGALAGVISRRDIFHGALAWTLGQGAAAHEKTLESYPVKQVMETEVTTISPGAALGEAAALMNARKIGCLPVIDREQLVGILTEGDFLALIIGSDA